MSKRLETQPAVEADAGGVSTPRKAISGHVNAVQKPAAVQDDAVMALRQLLRIEAEIRACRSLDELHVLLVNELRKMMGARQAYAIDLGTSQPRITKISGTGTVDRHAPMVRWLEKELLSRRPETGWAKPASLVLRCGTEAQDEDARAFPFPHGHWLPLAGRKRVESGVLVVAEQPFAEGPATIGDRIASTAAHAALVLAHQTPRRIRTPRVKYLMAGATMIVAAAMIWPVPMTALAPMEVVPQNAFVIAAPIDGVIEDIAVAPNAMVKAGDVLLRYVDTVPRNQLQLAEREVSVAEAKLRQLQQMIFVDERAKRDLAQARAELTLKIAERDFARDTFEKAQIRAPRDGVAIYADRKDWVGRPVTTGQRILEIADVDKVEVRAHLPVAEILDLKPGARARIFLDGNPLKPVDATILSTSHQARVVEGQGLVYRIQAQFNPGQSMPRPGVRGTAQLFSDTVPLAYYLFRRPMTWVRQKAGL
ncbi:MAG: efflux RND transporter periplasmic adaptor subunit [Beijerinckiaceae bacterium]